MSTTGDALLALLKSDLLEAAGKPLLEFLQGVQKSPDPVSQVAQLMKLNGALIAALPELELLVVQQITGILISKIQSALARAQAAANTPPPPAQPATN